MFNENLQKLFAEESVRQELKRETSSL